MAMMKGISAETPDAYVDALSGWQKPLVEMIRAAIHEGGEFQESIKWTNMLFSSIGPCIVIRAEQHRVIMAMFRGKRLAHLDPRIKPSGKFELANLIVKEGEGLEPELVTRIANAAATLNAEFGDPTKRHE